jgi:hypothetical protein
MMVGTAMADTKTFSWSLSSPLQINKIDDALTGEHARLQHFFHQQPSLACPEDIAMVPL